MSGLSISGLSVRYRNGVQALREINLDIAEGQCVGVVGESGSGKSTLLKAILGLLPRGTVSTGEIRPAVQSHRGTQIGYVGQDPFASANPLWTVGHHIADAWYVHRSRPDRGHIANRLKEFGIEARWISRRPHTWSGGMLQRADLLAGTAHRPPILLADEPTSALDSELADTALSMMKSQAPTVLVVSHDLALMGRHADRIVVLYRGRIVDDIAVSDGVAASATHPHTRAILKAATYRVETPRAIGEPVVTMSDVDLGYHSTVLSEVDIEVCAAEIVGIQGPSGSGKSTLLRAMSGLYPPRRGVIVPAASCMPIFQDTAASLDPRWPIWRTVAEPIAVAQGVSERRLRGDALALLADLELDDVDPDSRPGELSGGQRQRVAIARAVAGGPALIVADEPTASLDPTIAVVVARMLATVASRGCAVVVASHSANLLEALADRIFRINDGRLISSPRIPEVPSGADR